MSRSNRDSVQLSPIYIGGTVGQFTSLAVPNCSDSSGQMGQTVALSSYMAHRLARNNTGTGRHFWGDEKLCKKRRVSTDKRTLRWPSNPTTQNPSRKGM